jgi:hypothetical protein
VSSRSGDSDRSDVELARELVGALLRTGFALSATLAALLEDLPDHAFPGERKAEVLVDMFAGTCAPVARAAGPARCGEAVALIDKLHDKVLHDLRAAAIPSQRDG